MEQIPGKIETLLADQAFWRSSTKSVAVILTAEETLIHRLSIPVDDQYYVGDTPYLLAIIKNAQFNYAFYLLALNRDSMKVYRVENKQVTEVALPEDALLTLRLLLAKKSAVVEISIIVHKVDQTVLVKALPTTASVLKTKRLRLIMSITTKL